MRDIPDLDPVVGERRLGNILGPSDRDDGTELFLFIKVLKLREDVVLKGCAVPTLGRSPDQNFGRASTASLLQRPQVG